MVSRATQSKPGQKCGILMKKRARINKRMAKMSCENGKIKSRRQIQVLKKCRHLQNSLSHTRKQTKRCLKKRETNDDPMLKASFEGMTLEQCLGCLNNDEETFVVINLIGHMLLTDDGDMDFNESRINQVADLTNRNHVCLNIKDPEEYV